MEQTELLVKAMDMIDVPLHLAGNGRRNLKERLPEIVEHLVLESLGTQGNSWVEESVRLLRPTCYEDSPLYRDNMAQVYVNVGEIYDFIMSKGGKETENTRRFRGYVWMYQKATAHLGTKGICKDDAPKHF